MILGVFGTIDPESIQCKIEYQAFSPSYDLAPSPSPPLSDSPVNKLSLFLSLPVCRQSSLLTEGGGEEPKHMMLYPLGSITVVIFRFP